ncbi:MAG: CdvA-like protein [Nitrososphaerota archaeon]|jgi:hypothetical protein|nr:CdvA-like protein [Nitrososphaerota archaeon]
MISWKNSFKRLNEEYDLAKKKEQAVDNLFITGKISQLTRDTFNKDITAAIAEIERQQKDLVAKMQLKTDELTSQIKLLETLLANYEIQYVIGEIGNETYQRDILLFTIGIDTAKAELETITQATLQLCGPVQTIQAPITPDLPVAEPVIEAPISTETTAPVEISMPIDTPVESNPLETTPYAATSDTVETAPVLESAIVEEAAVDVAVEEAAVDVAVEEAAVDVAVEEAAVLESAIVEEAAVDVAVEEAAVLESAIVEEAPVEEAAVEMFDSFTPDMSESVIEVTAKEPVFLNADLAAVEAPVMDLAMDIVGDSPIENVVMDLPTEEATINLVEEQTLADVADVPLQVFEVTEQAPVEQTLEKVMEQLNSPAVEALTVEELTHSSHPTTAPHQALSEITAEAVSDEQIDESVEDITE